ncbi:MAG TPA: hypothetical protein VLJ10_04685 [Candidatus Bathyarchaeia archaeon]|nr:hypothetical protein [Candidatus Bathyarchaeia archaeon]
MSTIHDALKKVEHDMKPEDQQTSSPPTPQPTHNPFNKPVVPPKTSQETMQQTPEPPKRNGKKVIGIVITIILCCVLGFGITYAIDFFDLFPSQRRVFSCKISSFFSSFRPKPDDSPSVTEPAPKAKPVIKLQGVMVMGGKNLALINNDIYEVGDTVNNVEILNISSKQITVLENGEEKTIKVSK